ncbi:unnamed protein product [Miscanthus lutarioriparius]|uniref:Uncharacterized protein n=1 Tax=Miscanthus lutarioriparius TaxID=422564 RepID=A0A811MH76_9POAL|nr:unnamed protein product [Miscanthus lutarioriparius]
MSQRPHGQAPPSEMGDPNYAALLFQQQADGSTRRIGAAAGGWEQQANGRSQLQQDSPVLPWLENTAQGDQRRLQRNRSYKISIRRWNRSIVVGDVTIF